MSKVKCQKCEVSILKTTADSNNGLCVKCSRTPSVSPRRKAFVGIVMGSIFFMIGIGLGVWGHYAYKHLDHVQAHWTQVTGRITSVKHESPHVYGGERTFGIIQYSYEIDGTKYNSEYTHENSHRTNKGGQERDKLFYEKHQKGNPVKIFVNPAEHNDCLLEVEVLYRPLAKKLLMGGMVIFIIMALCRVSIDLVALARVKNS